jgi:hypothetical protein
MNYRRHDRCKDNCADPLLDCAIELAFGFELLIYATQMARNKFGHIDIENDDQTQQPPQISGPNYEPERVNRGSECEFNPTVGEYLFQFIHFSNFQLAVKMFVFRAICPFLIRAALNRQRYNFRRGK